MYFSLPEYARRTSSTILVTHSAQNDDNETLKHSTWIFVTNRIQYRTDLQPYQNRNFEPGRITVRKRLLRTCASHKDIP